MTNTPTLTIRPFKRTPVQQRAAEMAAQTVRYRPAGWRNAFREGSTAIAATPLCAQVPPATVELAEPYTVRRAPAANECDRCYRVADLFYDPESELALCDSCHTVAPDYDERQPRHVDVRDDGSVMSSY